MKSKSPPLVAWVLLSALLAQGAPPIEVLVGKEGKAAMPITISEKASPETREAAATLARYLDRIGSMKFNIVTGDGNSGIVLGLASDFPALDAGKELDAKGFALKEQYILRSHKGGVYALAATESGVPHAVWDLLYRLGYRQFFPGETWEVVPRLKTLTWAVDVNEKPDYFTRRIWPGYGLWDSGESALWNDWYARNRAAGGFELHGGHAFGDIIKRNKAAFAAHPEYYALVKGTRTVNPQGKLCISNPALRQLVVDYALDFFKRIPQADSVSIDPSDGGGWCECDKCAALGTPSDLELTLANDVSKALEEKMPDKYVAFYAYNFHGPPPHIEARPRVIITVAAGFLKGRTIEETIEGWKEKGICLFGIREYYSVFLWDSDLPARARGSRLNYLKQTIPHFYKSGARLMSAEASANWGPNGLGYYLATRMLWHVDEAEKLDALKADFFEKAFGPARKSMEAYYTFLDGSHPPVIADDLISRMYQQLQEAGRLADTADVRKRIDDLILYTRYVELHKEYSATRGPEHQAAFEQIMRHAYRMRKSMMIHSRALWRSRKLKDATIVVPENADWTVEEGKNPWKSSEPWTRAELDAMVSNGIAKNQRLRFEPVTYSRDLEPADPLNLPELPVLQDAFTDRGRRVFYTWVEKAPATVELKVTGGLIPSRGDVRVELKVVPGLEEDSPLSVAEAKVPPDGVEHAVILQAKRSGLYQVVVDDGMRTSRVIWPKGLYRTVESGLESAPLFSGARSAYFYVPRGTKVVGGFAGSGGGGVYNADGVEVLKFEAGRYFDIPVPAGQDGRLWSLRDCSRDKGKAVHLMTVPPFTAASPSELLLPREVVEADRASISKQTPEN